jgi:glutamate/tyrosine decarboxylase-like PLP-dependent enzyme
MEFSQGRHRSESEEISFGCQPLYANSVVTTDLPTDHFPQHSVPSCVAHQLIKDELSLDGNPKMNVSFCISFVDSLEIKLVYLI